MDRNVLVEQLLEARGKLMRSLGGMECLLHVELTMAQLKTLVLLAHEGVCSVGQVARGLGIGRPAASLLVDRLVHMALARRWEDAADRRRALVELTAAGRGLAAELYEGSTHILVQALERMTDEEIASLLRGMNALADALGQQAAATASVD
ncbi:MAG TPA: MarR family transcriptional regulator [Chloroflexota bacterium]|nr:MarR family transcriptional regulator [Chloroflexota bacterium]